MSSSMACIQGYFSFLSLRSQPKGPKHKQTLRADNESPWLCSTQPTSVIRDGQSQRTAVLRSYDAIADSLFLGAASPAKSGDISVILLTSAVMLLLYWITNFVVPNIMSKSLGFDEDKEDRSPKV